MITEIYSALNQKYPNRDFLITRFYDSGSFQPQYRIYDGKELLGSFLRDDTMSTKEEFLKQFCEIIDSKK